MRLLCCCSFITIERFSVNAENHLYEIINSSTNFHMHRYFSRYVISLKLWACFDGVLNWGTLVISILLLVFRFIWPELCFTFSTIKIQIFFSIYSRLVVYRRVDDRAIQNGCGVGNVSAILLLFQSSWIFYALSLFCMCWSLSSPFNWASFFSLTEKSFVNSNWATDAA